MRMRSPGFYTPCPRATARGRCTLHWPVAAVIESNRNRGSIVFPSTETIAIDRRVHIGGRKYGADAQVTHPGQQDCESRSGKYASIVLIRRDATRVASGRDRCPHADMTRRSLGALQHGGICFSIGVEALPVPPRYPTQRGDEPGISTTRGRDESPN